MNKSTEIRDIIEDRKEEEEVVELGVIGENRRGDYFLRDEFVNSRSNSPKQNQNQKTTSVYSRPRRKQSKPHRFREAAETKVITHHKKMNSSKEQQQQQGEEDTPTLDSESDVLVMDISDGSPAPEQPKEEQPQEKEEPKEEQKEEEEEEQKQPQHEEEEGTQNSNDVKPEANENNDADMELSDEQGQKDPGELPKKKVVIKRKRRRSKQKGAAESDDEEKTSSPAKKKRKRKKKESEKKFQQVENELEALFAGVVNGGTDSEAVKNESKQPKKSNNNPPPSTSAAKAKKTVRKSNATPNSAKKTNGTEKRKYRTKKQKLTNGSSNATTNNNSGTNSKKIISNKKKISQQEKLLEHFKGPFVRIRGPDKENPVWCNVINSPYDSIKPGDGLSKIDGISEIEQRARISNYGHTSTLSGKYDLKKPPDETWICIFCKKRSHYGCLGDLFGPYFVPNEIVANLGTPKKQQPADLAANFIIGGGNGKKRKRKKSAEQVLTSAKPSSISMSTGSLPPPLGQAEVWFHEDCLCWMQDIQIVGHHILGLEYAIQEAGSVKCVKCHLTGCSLCCSHLGCHEVIHFPCAKASKWSLDEDNFQAFCAKHSKNNFS